MNVLFLNSIEKETYGGVEEWTRLVGRALAERGHSVTVAGRRDSEYLRRAVADSAGVRPLALNISGDFNPVTIAALKRYMADNDVEVVVVNFNKDIRLGGLAARWEQRPAVIWRVGLNITKDNAVHRLLTPRLIDGVMVPSQALKAQITHFGYIDPSIVTVIPNGIEDGDYVCRSRQAATQLREKYEIQEDAVVAVTVGRCVRQKGHTYLIQAAAELVKRYPDLVFIVVGDGPRRRELEEQIESLGLRQRFVITGMVDRVDAILAGADLMVHTAIEEPFGIALIEGMRAGLPIVATRVGGIPEVVAEGQTGLLVELRNPAAIAEAVAALLSNRNRMHAMGRAGRERWQAGFQLNHMIDRVESFLSRFVPEGAQRGRR